MTMYSASWFDASISLATSSAEPKRGPCSSTTRILLPWFLHEPRSLHVSDSFGPHLVAAVFAPDDGLSRFDHEVGRGDEYSDDNRQSEIHRHKVNTMTKNHQEIQRNVPIEPLRSKCRSEEKEFREVEKRKADGDDHP